MQAYVDSKFHFYHGDLDATNIMVSDDGSRVSERRGAARWDTGQSFH